MFKVLYQDNIEWGKLNRYPYISKNQIKAFETAIAALSAEPSTDTILQEIWDKIDAQREELKTMAVDDDWYAGKIRGYDCALEIIDRYKKAIG